MGTPLKQMRFLLSPNRVATSPKFHNRLTVESSRACRSLNFLDAPNHNLSPKNVKKFECLKPPERSLLVNSPNKMNILKNGLQPFTDLSVLGRGTFGTVVKGTYKGQDVAVKVVKTRRKLNESNALKLNHQNVIRILDVIMKNERNSIIIMERTENGMQLQTLLNDEHVVLPEKQIVAFSLDICRGLQCCHGNDILHLDLKPANILVTGNGRCKICDFGNSMVVGERFEVEDYKGTIAYTAPEILMGMQPSFACDIYSLGVTFWQMKHRKVPFSEFFDKEVIIYKVVKYGMRPSSEMSEGADDYSDLYKACWSQKAENRPHLSTVINSLEKI